MSKWKNCQLGDIIKFQRGHDLPKTHMLDGEYPVIGSNGVIGYHNTYTTNAPSITVGRSGNTGNPYIVYGRSWSHNTTLYVKEFKGSDPIYVYYLLKTLDLKNFAGGSAVPTLNRNHIHTLDISVPPLKEQVEIGRTLRAFDDKIENNAKINHHLEQMAQAIYKSWFVDFEPWGGAMPDDWQKAELGEVVFLSAGGDKPVVVSPTPTEECTVPIYSNGIDNFGLYGFTDFPKITDESVTVSARGTIGFVCLREEPFVPIVRLVTAIPNIEFLTAKFLFLFLKNAHIAGVGTTQQQLTVPDFKKFAILVPNRDTVESFTQKVNPIFDKMRHNREENINFTTLRDTLLPRLMSGELSVSDIQATK